MSAIITTCDEHGHNPTCKSVEFGCIKTNREQRRQLKRDNAKLPTWPVAVPREQWPASAPTHGARLLYRMLKSR